MKIKKDVFSKLNKYFGSKAASDAFIHGAGQFLIDIDAYSLESVFIDFAPSGDPVLLNTTKKDDLNCQLATKAGYYSVWMKTGEKIDRERYEIKKKAWDEFLDRMAA